MALPIKAIKNVNIPIIAMEKWQKDDEGYLTKKYTFDDISDRNKFLMALFSYEDDAGHHANFTVSKREVIIKLMTLDVNKVTELDKEYAKYADVVRRDIAYKIQND